MMSTKGHVLGSAAVGSATSTNLVTGSQPGAASSSGAAAAYQEFSVRVPKLDKPMSVMRFNGALNVDLAKWSTLKMIRDDHTTRKTVDHHTSNFEQAEMPKFGAGSEYGREAREEARRRKYGQHKKKINAEDHPWVLKATTTDKQAKRFKGIREGTISSNASYFVFTQATDGQFEVFPVSQWYNFTPVQTYKALSAEEAEEEFGRRDKIMNYFSVMVRKRMKGDEADGVDKDEEKISKKKGRGGGGLKVSEMEDWDDVNEIESDDDDEEEGNKDKKKKKAPNSKKKKKKGSDSEANEDSDDGDGEGRELDYISDSSMSSSDDEEGGAKKLDLPGVEQESGLRNLLESDSSDEEEKEEKPEEDTEAEAEKNKGKTSKKNKKGKKKPNEAQSSAAENLSDGDSDSDDSEHPTNEAEAPAKSPVAVSPEKEKTPEVEGDAESRKRKLSPVTSPAAKKNKLEVSSVLLQTAASEGITEEAIRRYLLRKPMTVTGLLQKFKSKKTKVSSMSSEDMVTIIASILKKINPTKRNQNNKMYLFLKA